MKILPIIRDHPRETIGPPLAAESSKDIVEPSAKIMKSGRYIFPKAKSTKVI